MTFSRRMPIDTIPVSHPPPGCENAGQRGIGYPISDRIKSGVVSILSKLSDHQNQMIIKKNPDGFGI